MLKKILMAAGLAAAFTLSAQAAEAKVKIVIGIGGYPNSCYDRYDPFHCGDGYYPRPRFYDPYRPAYNPYPPAYDSYDPYNRVSCDDARWMLSDQGYHDIRVNSCGGRYYVFIARKHHQAFVIKVSSRSGEIRSIRPL